MFVRRAGVAMRPSHRKPTQKVSPQQVLDFAEAVRALLRQTPSLTVAELVRRTGAPRQLVTLVRQRWRFASSTGVVP